jgi:hypothetical protein
MVPVKENEWVCCPTKEDEAAYVIM